jgi:hypothetical protein
MTYLDFCNTDIQREMVQHILDGGNPSSWATSRGSATAEARRKWQDIRRRAALAGYAPEQGFDPPTVPPGFVLDKSTVHAKDGMTVQRWDRVSADKEAAREAVLNAISEACVALPALPSVSTPKSADEDLLTLYTIADLHVGLYSWGRESGEDYSTAKAKELLWACFGQMIESSPKSEMCCIASLGDFMHFCGLISETCESHNTLDADSRYQKMAEITLDLHMWMVESALKKHKAVHLICEEGNHDRDAVPWLRVAMTSIFRNNKRVTVDDSPAPYHGFLFGDNMIATHHGHKKKDKALGEFFAADPRFRKMWGAAKRTYVHTGHLHSQSVNELPGAIVERHPTLAARSSYESRGGWVSQRAAKSKVYHKTKGEVASFTFVPEI